MIKCNVAYDILQYWYDTIVDRFRWHEDIDHNITPLTWLVDGFLLRCHDLWQSVFTQVLNIEPNNTKKKQKKHPVWKIWLLMVVLCLQFFAFVDDEKSDP